MCHFITATLPGSVDTDAVAALFEAHKRGFALVSNPYVAEQLDRGDRYVLTTRKHCDCGTPLGTLARVEAVSSDHDVDAREVAKLRRRGWSEAKIGRWQSQVEHDRARRQREDHAQATTGTRDAADWIDLVTELLGSGATPRIGLLLHWYRGGVESERIAIRDRKQVGVPRLVPEQLMRMDEDVLYDFVVAK